VLRQKTRLPYKIGKKINYAQFIAPSMCNKGLKYGISRLAPLKMNQAPIIRNKMGNTVEKLVLKIRFGKLPAKENTSNKGRVPRPNSNIKRKLLVKESAFTADAKAI